MNHGIILLERIDIEKETTSILNDAIVNGCVVRLRPIVLTTLTTCLGLLSLMIFGGPFWYGLTTVIAYGLFIGTFVTLFIVPIIYSYLFKDEGGVSAFRNVHG